MFQPAHYRLCTWISVKLNIQNNYPPPPYYSVAVQPPLKSHEEVIYGVNYGIVQTTAPQYVTQNPLPVANTIITQHSFSPSSSKKKECSSCSGQCCSGSGATVFILALIAVIIWLGVHYGLRSATPGIFHTAGSEECCKDEKQWSLIETDSCSNFTVECDALQDCQQGSDETSCVRFAQGGVLQVRTALDGRFLPVCSQGWDQSLADQTCAQLGFRRSFVSYSVKNQISNVLNVQARRTQLIQGFVNVSSSCPNESTVNLECTDCGKQQLSSRIIGGSLAQLGRWPWQVSLHFNGMHICGGTLISQDFVVTAAHCFPDSNPTYMDVKNWCVYTGVISQNKLPDPYFVKKILLHNKYNKSTDDYDIALLKITRPAEMSSSVNPACLPAFDKSFPTGAECWTSGFGTTAEGSDTGSVDLRGVAVSIIDVGICNGSDVYRGRISVNMMCAGDMQGGRDSCQGDSGGPLVCQDSDQRWYLAGVTSWGTGCGRQKRPGVYSKVTSFLPWIHSIMQVKSDYK
ncbi:transmembrane protease serine 13a [Hoplias malabaricus]|uniref:transmembrane protease serine 13a n=1 Tax=Hoplias malabaricus TaxID=27720 RepID=UPI0034637C9D